MVLPFFLGGVQLETGRLSVHTYTAESKSVKSSARLDRSLDGESQGFALQRRQHFSPRFTSPTLPSKASTHHDEVPITFFILPPATASLLPRRATATPTTTARTATAYPKQQGCVAGNPQGPGPRAATAALAGGLAATPYALAGAIATQFRREPHGRNTAGCWFQRGCAIPGNGFSGGVGRDSLTSSTGYFGWDLKWKLGMSRRDGGDRGAILLPRC